MFEFLPDELKKFGLFCGWKLTERGKIPFNLITGSNAKSNDRSTFCGWDKAESLVKQYIEKVDGKMLGGLGLGIFNGFSAVDIDHCVDKGKINDFAQGLIDYFQSYTEFSPSGTGIRIIFKTDDKVDKEKFYINNSKIGLEIYVEGSTNKFVTLTGNAINSYLTDIVKVDIKPILNQYMTKTAVAPNRPVASIGVGAPDIRPFLNRDAKLNHFGMRQHRAATLTRARPTLLFATSWLSISEMTARQSIVPLSPRLTLNLRTSFTLRSGWRGLTIERRL
jgi:hypothetical protein